MNATFTNWECFRFAGKQFLMLISGQSHQVYGDKMEWYGSFQSRESFQKFYKEQGEQLNLNK